MPSMQLGLAQKGALHAQTKTSQSSALYAQTKSSGPDAPMSVNLDQDVFNDYRKYQKHSRKRKMPKSPILKYLHGYQYNDKDFKFLMDDLNSSTIIEKASSSSSEEEDDGNRLYANIASD